VDAIIPPEASLEILSRMETSQLRDAGETELHEIWRLCSLAVLNSGAEQDDVRQILREYEQFSIAILPRQWGIELQLQNAPDRAFVDGKMIRGIREQLFAVLRDLLYTHDEILSSARFDLSRSESVTDAIFHILRNAQVLRAGLEPKVVVCWGGHAISREEYDYSKSVGYHLGLRGLDVCTGCGAGAMKGPMKGAALGHAKQRIRDGRYIGLTEPTIIAAESPNPIVNELVIMPDMEKRLEAFVRVAHAIVVFPGGVGTAEEILYLLGILLDDANQDMRLPLILAGPASSRAYFERLDAFIGKTLGRAAQSRYQIMLGSPEAVAQAAAAGLEAVREFRSHCEDAFLFNWLINIGTSFQQPFDASHESMEGLALTRTQPAYDLAVNLRRAFSGIVAGNIRDEGIRRVEARGPFVLRGDNEIVTALDVLLRDFIAQGRMRLTDPENYVPCFQIAA
jgi:predicted Rossmann-fold nucleotide-binding protein